MKKTKFKEPKTRMCTYCGTEMVDSYQCIKTKRGSDLYICPKCVNEAVKQNK